MSYHEDRRWSERFLDEIRQIVGAYLLRPATYEADAKQATDLMILRAEPWTVACRMRQRKYYSTYPWDFTIRSDRPTGARTELEKILEGFGDLFFYGFADAADRHLWFYSLLDLSIFRAWRAQVTGTTRRNRGETTFVAYDIRDFPRGFVRARAEINSAGQLGLFARLERI